MLPVYLPRRLPELGSQLNSGELDTFALVGWHRPSQLDSMASVFASQFQARRSTRCYRHDRIPENGLYGMAVCFASPLEPDELQALISATGGEGVGRTMPVVNTLLVAPPNVDWVRLNPAGLLDSVWEQMPLLAQIASYTRLSYESL